MTELALTVLGRPQPAGSKRHVGRGRIIDSNPKAAPWKQEVAAAAAAKSWDDGTAGELLAGPLSLAITFYLARPVGHYGSGRNRHVLRPSAPLYPVVRPDTLKLVRGAEDALTGVLWRDDAQVVVLAASKLYGEPERTEITIREIERGAAA